MRFTAYRKDLKAVKRFKKNNNRGSSEKLISSLCENSCCCFLKKIATAERLKSQKL